jgi:hypothetical protein
MADNPQTKRRRDLIEKKNFYDSVISPTSGKGFQKLQTIDRRPGASGLNSEEKGDKVSKKKSFQNKIRGTGISA